MSGISAPGADEAEHHKADDPRRDRRTPDPQNSCRRFGCVVPPALIELDARPPGEVVEAVELEAELAEVREPCVDVAGGEVVPPRPEGALDEKRARESGEMRHPRRPRTLEAFLEHRPAACCEVSRCDDRPGTKDELAVAELFPEGESVLCKRPILFEI